MRRWFVISLPVLALFSLSSARGDEKGPLAVGNNLPSSFHPYNINAAVTVTEEIPDEKAKQKSAQEPYSTRRKFHCLISQFDLDPTVMLIVRLSEDNAALRDLLTRLDAAIERNRRVVRLRAFVVFLHDDLKDLVTQDDKREEHARKLERLAEDLKLRNVVLSLASKSDLAKYGLQDEDALTAVLYKKLKIVSSYRVPADKLSAARSPALEPMLADVADKNKLGATK